MIAFDDDDDADDNDGYDYVTVALLDLSLHDTLLLF